MFERSPLGIQNRALFLRVQYVVYTEGDVNGDPDASVDRAYWSRIFALFRPDLKVSIYTKGGKSEVTRFADHIIANDIANAVVALDRDHDDILGLLIADRRVVYTHGYSWENDILCSKVCTGTIRHILFSAVARRTKVTLSQHEALIDRFRWLNILDQVGIAYGQSVIDRSGFRKFAEFAQGEITLHLERSAADVTRLRVLRKAQVKAIPCDSDLKRRLFGKLYLYIFYLVIRRDVTPNGRRLSEDEFRSILFSSFRNTSRRDLKPKIRSHYQQVLAAI
jgi:hypothetical protein